jgi:hypothetical protein
MVLPLNPTFNELVNEVLIRCGYSTEGNQAVGVLPVCQSYVAAAEKELFPECEWLKAARRTTIELVEDVSDVDWPDDCAPGEILMVTALKTNDDDTISRFPMGAGARLQERDLAASEAGQPLVYEYIDEIIRIYPAPSEDWTSIEVDYRVGPSLYTEDDRTVVDGELLVQRATFKMKEYLDLPIGQVEMANHERYLARLRAASSQRSGIQLGGHKSYQVYPHLKNRVGDTFAPSNDFNNFHPW